MSRERKLKIRCDSGGAHDARVWLNDFEISHFLNGLTLEMKVGEANHVELRLTPLEVDIDADTLAALSAYVLPPVMS